MTQQDSPQTNEDNILDAMDQISGDDDTNIDTQTSWTAPSQDEVIAGLQAALARSQADYQNLLMRVERDKADMAFFLSAKILTPLLTQVDNLERAVALKADVQGDAFVDGIRSMLGSFHKFLESQNVRAFDSIGSSVDPDRHDVLSQAPGKEGIIVTEYEKGYTLGDRVLRHAKVVVGNGSEA